MRKSVISPYFLSSKSEKDILLLDFLQFTKKRTFHFSNTLSYERSGKSQYDEALPSEENRL